MTKHGFKTWDKVMVTDRGSPWCGRIGVLSRHSNTESRQVTFHGIPGPQGSTGTDVWFLDQHLILADSPEALIFRVLES